MDDEKIPTEETINEDAINNFDMLRLGQSLNLFGNKNGDNYNIVLGHDDIEQLFNSNGLIRKIITKYPENARGIGYKIVNKDGVCINENDPIVLEGFYDSTIYARLYGYACLAFNFLKSKPEDEISIGLKIDTFSISTNVTEMGDFYYINGVKYHKSKVFIFRGDRKFRYFDPNNHDTEFYKNQSVLQTIYHSFRRLLKTTDSTRYIVDNLSYLLVGITNLTSLNNTDAGKTILSQKMLALNRERSIDKIISFDLSKEEVSFINQSLSGLDEVLNQFKILLASETNYPYEQLFENGSGVGIGSGIQNQLVSRFLWQENVNKWIFNNWKSNYELLKNRIFGEEYKLEIPFEVQLTITEKAELEKTVAERNKILIDSGVIIPEEARSNYQGDTFDFNLKLDEKVSEKDEKVKISATDINSNKSEKIVQPDDLPNNLGMVLDSQDVIPTDEEFDSIAKITMEDILGVIEE